MKKASIQICGTGSGVGKSVLTAGLCRIFLQDGFKVAPFKAQNMSLNSFVTIEGGEIGRAQAMQAAACHLKPSVDMNPVLLKPTSNIGSQVIVCGKPVGNMSALEYDACKNRIRTQVLKSFHRLKKRFNVIVIEGAGSPAEVNLKARDIVNMKMAEAADAPVILVGDIDKGGVFAWLVGTLELLSQKERRRVKGFIINKFRGDKRLLKPGIDYLEKKTGLKVLGVVPYFTDIKIPEEDSAALQSEQGSSGVHSENLIQIAVIKLPHLSNFTDFDALKNEPDVSLYYRDTPRALRHADVIIIPGTKNTIGDLGWLKETGFAAHILSVLKTRPHCMLIGVCGGFQMLGREICDEQGIESCGKKGAALGLLPMVTHFEKEKILAQVRAKEMESGLEVTGYEIHHGRTQAPRTRGAFRIFSRQGKKAKESDGYRSKDGRVWGTYIHGIFDNPAFRRSFLNRVRARKGWPAITGVPTRDLDAELDKLAELLRNHLNMESLYRVLFGGKSK